MRNLSPDVPKKSDSRYQKQKTHKHFSKRASIKPTIDHLKSDYRLGRNFYKDVAEDTVSEQYLTKMGFLRDD